MATKFCRLVALLMAVMLCLSITGCNGQDGKSVYLNYNTGVDSFGRYNYALYGLNGKSDPTGADPGVFYVSEEEDPQWGGYFYRYVTSELLSVPTTGYCQENNIVAMIAYCDRSKDLYHWESAGALPGGYSCAIDSEDWCTSNFWAPEVVRNPGDGKYYMYFSAAAKQDLDSDCISHSDNYMNRLCLAVAVSDTPVGPFDVICDYDPQTRVRIPTINFKTGLNMEYNVPAIDAHPFFDDNGELYLYFVPHISENNASNHIVGMKMKSMAYADYATVTVLAYPGVSTVESTPGDLVNFKQGEKYFSSEGGCNEAPFVYKHGDLYYLTYSSNGFSSISYGIHQAVGASPLGPFTKLTQEQGNPVLDGSLFGDVHGTGHHSLVKNGDELWIAYHRHSSIYDGVGWGRPTAVDRLSFVKNSEGVEVLTANGPSRTLTWLPEHISGYENVAKAAQISVNNGNGAQYLNDGILPLYQVAADKKLRAEKDDVTITLYWNEPVNISSILIYNSALTDSAFSKVSSVRFKLAETPAWASTDYTWAVIQDLPLQQGAWNADSEDYYECAPAIAEFDEITVTEIQITIAGSDRLVEFNRMGQTNTAVDVGEIVVLGKAVPNE